MTVPTSTPVAQGTAAVPRTLTARVTAGSTLRTATYLQDTFIITDVIAMVGDSVIRPLGSRGPEYVPAYVLAAAPQGWNNRPCTLDHPASGTQSANDPTTLERYCFGHVFNARFEDGKLKLEAWLSRARAEAVGPEAVRFIERVEAGEMAEVSIGAYVGVEKRSGIAANGASYEYVWTDLAASDHLAMLPEGAVGACSVDGHGCGTNRTARQAAIEQLTLAGSTLITGGDMPVSEVKLDISGGRTLRQAIEWLGSMLGIGQRSAAEAEGLSDSELRGRLWDALYSIEPAFGGIVDIYPDSSSVIYTTSPEGNYSWWRQSFTIDDGAAVSLNDDRQEVKPVMTYENVAAEDGSQKGTESRAACSCQHSDSPNNVHDVHAGEGQAAPSPTTTQGEPMTDKKKALIGRLTANQRVPIPEATLQTLSEEQLEEMAGLYEAAPKQPASQPPANPPADPQQPSNPPAQPAQPVNASGAVPPRTVTIPEEDFQAMRRAAAAFQAQEQARKTTLVGQLKVAQQGFSETELAAMPIETLEKLAINAGLDRLPSAGAGVADYSGRGLAYTPSSAHDAAIQRALNPPDPYGLNVTKKEAN